MTHHIRRQILELELTRERDAATLQRRASSAFQERVLPELDRLFGQMAPENRIVRLDKLEIDLGDLDERNWEQRFVERCIEMISRQVSEAAFKAEDPSENGPLVMNIRDNAWEILSFFLANGVLPWYANHLTLQSLEGYWSEPNSQSLPPVSLLNELGNNPVFQARLIQNFKFESASKLIENAIGLAPGWLPQALEIRRNQTGKPVSKLEIVYFIDTVIQLRRDSHDFSVPESHWISWVFNEMENLYSPSFKRQKVNRDLKQKNSALEQAGPEDTADPSNSELVNHSTHSTNPSHENTSTGSNLEPIEKTGSELDSNQISVSGNNPSSLSNGTNTDEEHNHSPSERINPLRRAFNPDTETEHNLEVDGHPTRDSHINPTSELISPLHHPDDHKHGIDPGSSPAYTSDEKSTSADGSNVHKKKPETPPKSNTSRTYHRPSGSKNNLSGSFRIDHAGLVLLAPYLPTLFHRVELNFSVEDITELKDLPIVCDDRIYKALHLLHFLATGEQNPEEPQLALPKILCGIQIGQVVISESDLANETLTSFEIEEAENLLQAVIQNWPVLKNTTPQGLQNGFLRRPGLMAWEEGRLSWLLRVERQSMDILLDRLPWGYSVVRLPWMGQMIQVEW